MCDGKYQKDPVIAESHRRMRYVRSKASYFLRGRYRKIGGKNCVYCGFKAQTGDHVPALFLGFLNGVEKGVIVSSCYDCNKYLGKFESTCLKIRSEYLAYIYENIDQRPSSEEFNSLTETDRNDRMKAYMLKVVRCKQRMDAKNCNMLLGSAALFSENGESGGEITTYDSLEHIRLKHRSRDELINQLF